MALLDVYSDLHSLRKLYGLLLINGDGLQNLDDKACFLLKKLLDGATQRAFEAHSKILAARLGASGIPSSIQSEQIQSSRSMRMPTKLQSRTSCDSQPSPSTMQNSENNSNLDMVGKDKRDKVSNMSPTNLSAMETGNRKKRCRLCEQSSLKQMNPAMATKPSDEKTQILNKSYQPELAGDLVKEVNIAIKRIDSMVPALQLYNEVASSVNHPIESPSEWTSQRFLEPKDISLVHQLPIQIQKPDSGIDNSLSQEPNPNGGAQNVKAMVKRIESLSQVASQNKQMSGQSQKYVQGLRVLPCQKDETKKENREQSPTAHNDSIRQVASLCKSKISPMFFRPNFVSTADPDPKLSPTRIKKKDPSYQMITRPTLLRPKSSHFTVASTLSDQTARKTSRVCKSTHTSRSNRPLPSKQEMEYMSSSSGCSPSSSWTTRETSTSISDSKDYSSPPSRMRGHHLMGPTSRRIKSPLRGEGPQCSSNGDSEEYSTPPARTRAHHQMGTTSSRIKRSLRGEGPQCSSNSDSEDYSPRPSWTRAHHQMEPPSRRIQRRFRDEGQRYHVAPSKSYKVGRQMGRLRRLKNKLGLIFHHHHHHHHHYQHDESDDDGNSSDMAEVGHGRSLWRSVGKMFHPSSKGDRDCEDRIDHGNLRRSVVKKVPNQHQIGHFHRLVEGLLSHVCHSKKSKRTKAGNRRLRDRTRGHDKKVVKRLHWWQKLRRRRGVKLPDKGHVRLGFASKKKPRLRAPKMR